MLLHYVVQVIWHALQKMLVTFRQDATLIFGGNTEPAALAELYYAAGGQWSGGSTESLTDYLMQLLPKQCLVQGLGMIYTPN